MSKNILCLKGISKAFGGVHALDNVDLCVKEGQIHCLMGENGSGKSTLIKVISGVYQPDSGEIMLNGNLYHKLNPAESVRQGVQIIYQDFSVFPNLTVAENIIFGQTVAEKQKLTHNKKKRQNAAKIAQEIGLKADLSEIVENLSVAEKQMVAICRALLNDAKLLIFDEPTTALTQKEVKNLFALIHKMQKKGVSTLFVSHKLEEVFEIAEEFTILRNGKKVITTDAASITREKFIFYMTGRQLSEKQFVMNVCKTGDPLLEVRDLSMEGFYKNVNFSLYPGEILGIVGLLGSGRTELALSLFGVKPADNGKILKNGKVIQITSILEAMKNRIGYVPEDRLSEGLFLPQSINWNVGIANLKAYSGRFGKLEKKKMEQVSAIAASVAIVTGLPFLESVAKGVLISAWSMAEAVNDMKILLSGGKVALTKSKGGWRTSIGNVTNGSKKEDSKGLSYKEYCQILIAVQNTGDSLYRIMDLIQINIQKRVV